MLGTYHAGERVATHRLLPSCVANSCSTDPAHMPEAFLEHEWDDVRIKRWALEIGPDCAAVIHRMFDRAKIKCVLSSSRRQNRRYDFDTFSVLRADRLSYF